MEAETKKSVIHAIMEKKVIAIFRGIAPEKVPYAADALSCGGVPIMEITFDQKEERAGFRTTIEGIRKLSQMGRAILVGAGTVLSPQQVVLAYNAGAKFIITPTMDPEVIQLANSLGMVTMPGAYTPTEINNAYKVGADFVKVFPASEAGPSYFKALQGPLGHIRLTAVGGVGLENAADFLKAGAVGLGIGGSLVNRKLIEAGDYAGLRELAGKFSERVRCVK